MVTLYVRISSYCWPQWIQAKYAELSGTKPQSLGIPMHCWRTFKSNANCHKHKHWICSSSPININIGFKALNVVFSHHCVYIVAIQCCWYISRDITNFCVMLTKLADFQEIRTLYAIHFVLRCTCHDTAKNCISVQFTRYCWNSNSHFHRQAKA